MASAANWRGRGQRHIARVGLVQPGLRGGTVGRLQLVQFFPGFIGIVAQRGCGDPRHHGAAIIANAVCALDRDEFGRAGLQPLEHAGTGGGIVLLRRQQLRQQRQQLGAEPDLAFGTPLAAN